MGTLRSLTLQKAVTSGSRAAAMPCSSMAVQSWGGSRGEQGTFRGRLCPTGRRSPPALPYLQAAVHHADDEVELLVVQHGAVLLHVQVQLLGQAVPGGPALHGTQHGREQLWERGLRGGTGPGQPCSRTERPHTTVTGGTRTRRQSGTEIGCGGGGGAQGHWEMEQGR